MSDWRLPNIVELLSLIDYGKATPALLTGHHFSGVMLEAYYWSSTTNANVITLNWGIYSTYGVTTSNLDKATQTAYIMCVRD